MGKLIAASWPRTRRRRSSGMSQVTGRKSLSFSLALLFAVAGGGTAVASPPANDPSCNSSETCAGDQGRGDAWVCERAPDNGGTELAVDVLQPGGESDCDDGDEDNGDGLD